MELVLLLLAGCARSTTPQAEAPGKFCRFVADMHPHASWKEVRPGDRLSVPGALLTCDSSEVQFRAAARMSADIDWESHGDTFDANIGPNELIPLSTAESDPPSPAARVEVTRLSGRVWYSVDMPATYGRVVAGSRGSTLEKTLAASLAELEAELKSIDWEPLQEGRVLGEWDMVWTGDDGRLEIEMLPDSKTRSDRARYDLQTTVIDGEDRPTAGRRFLPRTYLILNPDFYGPAKVNRILGTVYVARDHDQVKAFFASQRSTMRMLARLNKEEIAKRKEFLKSPTLK